jgi:hypothetical protein
MLLLAGAAHADDDAFHATPAHAVGVAFVLHVSNIGGEVESGPGAGLELALGSGRWQYFAEGMMAHADLGSTMAGAPEYDAHGWMGRGGIGVRWLARQMVPDPGGAVELYLEAVTGLERYWWHSGGELTRPDLGAGIGMQIRAWQLRGFTLRIGTRVMFAPTDREAVLVACRGSGCPVTTGASVAGLAVNVGVAW